MEENIPDCEDEEEQVPPVLLTKEAVANLMTAIKVPEPVSERITKAYAEEFEEDTPTVDELLDTKAMAAGAARKKETELFLEVEALKTELKEEKSANSPGPEKDVILKVSPDKVSEIKTETINGQKCIIIPLSDNEHANINGTRFE